MTPMEHHSNLIPGNKRPRRREPLSNICRWNRTVRLDMDKAKETITSRTKLLAIAHVSNVLRDDYPISEMAELVHQHGAVIVVDGAQSVPHMKVDVQELGVDFLAFSGHKMWRRPASASYTERNPSSRGWSHWNTAGK